MIKKFVRCCLITVMGASSFGLLGGGCIDLDGFLRQGVFYAASEFLLDNDASPLGATGDLFAD